MKEIAAERYYHHAPQEQVHALLKFRANHTQNHRSLQGLDWSYLYGGQGQEVIVFLPGGLGLAESWFQVMTVFERDYRTFAVTYPFVSTMSALVDGLASLLATEGIHQAQFIGASFGGMLAQCFARKYPGIVNRLILANTAAPDPTIAASLEKHNRRALKYALWLVRWASLRSFERQYAAVPAGDRAFWSAYFKEAMNTQWDRGRMASQSHCAVDFNRNEVFSPGELAFLKSRILIIESADDQAFPSKARARLRSLYPEAGVYTFQHAGHTPLITQRDLFIAVVKAFLTQSQ